MSTTATKEKVRPVRGQEIMMVRFDDLAIEEGFNCREDYGDIDELVNSIKANGVKVPLRGHKEKDGKYYITDGHRRFKAITELNKKGVEMLIPMISDSKDSEEQRVINLIICNQGKKLNPVEEGNVVQRLINYNYSEKEISERLGFSKIYVKNLMILNNAPKKVRDLVSNKTISHTQVLDLMREEKDFGKVQEKIEKAVVVKQEKADKKEGGTAKITKKDIQATVGKQNSSQHLKKAMRIASKKKLDIIEEKREIYNFVNKIAKGLMSMEDIFEELFIIPEGVDLTTETVKEK